MKSEVIYCRCPDLGPLLNVVLDSLKDRGRYVVNMTQSMSLHNTNGIELDWALVVLWHVESPKQLHPIGVN